MEHYSAGGPQLLEGRHRMEKHQIVPLQWCDITTPASAQTQRPSKQKAPKKSKKKKNLSLNVPLYTRTPTGHIVIFTYTRTASRCAKLDVTVKTKIFLTASGVFLERKLSTFLLGWGKRTDAMLCCFCSIIFSGGLNALMRGVLGDLAFSVRRARWIFALLANEKKHKNLRVLADV